MENPASHCSRFRSHSYLILRVDPKFLLYVPLSIEVYVWSADARLSCYHSQIFMSVVRCLQPFQLVHCMILLLQKEEYHHMALEMLITMSTLMLYRFRGHLTDRDALS
jgi:hypothetical protein